MNGTAFVAALTVGPLAPAITSASPATRISGSSWLDGSHDADAERDVAAVGHGDRGACGPGSAGDDHGQWQRTVDVQLQRDDPGRWPLCVRGHADLRGGRRPNKVRPNSFLCRMRGEEIS